MNLETLVNLARRRGGSDLHVEAGQPALVRVSGELQSSGVTLSAADTLALARQVIPALNWPTFEQRRSFDFSALLAGTRCRINVFWTSGGVGFAVRLLARTMPTIETLNLHPELKQLVRAEHGLVLVSGPTGSGKSSTMAGFIEEINLTTNCHILTVEEPIEYAFRSKRAFIRQREVGSHTPSFEQALQDALREDPDVLMVGEMRHPEVMQLTLNFAETGHLVFATVHSSNTSEALQRIVAAFPSEIQGSVSGQLADTLIGVVAQRLRYRPELNMRIPECEVLMGTPAVRNLIRQGHFFKLESSLTTGAKEGMFTFERYQQWLQSRTRWSSPPDAADPVQETYAAPTPAAAVPLPLAPAPVAAAAAAEAQVIELDAGDEDLGEIMSQLRDVPRH